MVTQSDIIDLAIKNSEELSNQTITQEERNLLLKAAFLNKHTLQLTYRGLCILNGVFESHKINLPDDYELRSKDLITLDRECLLPYYVSVKVRRPGISKPSEPPFIILFERELAMLLKLSDGDLDMVRDMPRDGVF